MASPKVCCTRVLESYTYHLVCGFVWGLVWHDSQDQQQAWATRRKGSTCDQCDNNLIYKTRWGVTSNGSKRGGGCQKLKIRIVW